MSERCPVCNTPMEFLAGEPAHPANLYCPNAACGRREQNPAEESVSESNTKGRLPQLAQTEGFRDPSILDQVPPGWRIRYEDGAAQIISPDGSGAWFGTSDLKDRLVSQLVEAIVVGEAFDQIDRKKRSAQ
ncbi:hypothetical protein [Thioalkalivibrio sp. ALE19]|uniref:hypothetical protein n=1 Tax=Thioalkalivibrio sp. ALE19 TaxID=1266909 RepID=UPI00048F41B8|nr:hypothetical protein [Thioalkalivibrio sp. ALE19]